MRGLIPLLVVTACGHRSEPTQASPPLQAPASLDAGPPQPIVTATHGGQIATVAVAERGDVALSADENGDLRFWPALDGTHEPVVVRGSAPIDIALAREHDGHVAALLDAANGIELLRVRRDGVVRGRQVLPAEPGYVELAAATTALLARRTDHAIVRLDANITSPEPLAPEQGEQVIAIAARRESAIAGIADRERASEIRFVREIQIGPQLAWGRLHELPEPLAPPIAVSPSGTRVAGLNARTGMGIVIELAAKPRIIGRDISGSASAEAVVGFLDEDHVVFRSGVLLTVSAATAVADPWNRTPSTVRVRLGRGAVVVDNAVIGGHGTHLVIADGEGAKFLGYQDLGVGSLRVTGPQITLAFGVRVRWLDDKLSSLRAFDVLDDAAGGIAVDDTHVLKATYAYVDENRSKLDIALYDALARTEVPLGSWPHGATVTYDPETSVFAVSGYTTTVARTYLDLATGQVKALRALEVRANSTIELLDPKAANGAIAVAYAFGHKGVRIATFVDDGKSNQPISPSSSVTIGDVVWPIGVDRTGTTYMLAVGPGTEAKPIYAHKAGKEVTRVMVDGSIGAGAVDRAGTMLAAFSTAHISLYELDGKERWRVPVWSVNMARFTADGKTLLVNTGGGLLALDSATGERRAASCAWNFGLSSDEPQLAIFIAPVVCAEAR